MQKLASTHFSQVFTGFSKSGLEEVTKKATPGTDLLSGNEAFVYAKIEEARIHDPHIGLRTPTFYGFNSDGELKIQKLSGVTFETVLRTEIPVSEKLLVLSSATEQYQLLRDVVGVCHNDPKPSNVMVCGDGAYLIDFAFSLGAEEFQEFTKLFGFLRTDTYASPIARRQLEEGVVDLDDLAEFEGYAIVQMVVDSVLGIDYHHVANEPRYMFPDQAEHAVKEIKKLTSPGLANICAHAIYHGKVDPNAVQEQLIGFLYGS